MPRNKKSLATKKIEETVPGNHGSWKVQYGKLKRGKGHPGKVEHLFKIVGEKIPFDALADVKNHLTSKAHTHQGVYVAHDSMGCPRYIGRGDIFVRLSARKKKQPLELHYFSFYVVSSKKHEREIETLLIRAGGFLLEFNDRKKQVGLEAGNIRDYEAGTIFYERQRKKGKKPKKPKTGKMKRKK